MDQRQGELTTAAHSDNHERHEALWSITVVTDAEALSVGRYPLDTVMQQVERLRYRESGTLVPESVLPEIRCLAMLLAAGRARWEQGSSPERFSDESDWLAARIQLLSLSHVECTLEQLPALDLANRRLRSWCAAVGVRAVSALPVLLTHSRALPGRPGCLRGWSRTSLLMPCYGATQGHRVAQAIRQRCRERFGALMQVLEKKRAS
jgi:hypothetical protein